MIVLGIDPGIARLGYGIVEENGQEIKAIDYGCFETDKKIKHAQRLVALHKELIRIIEKYRPEKVAVEQLFFSQNVKTALVVGEARGVIMLTCAENNIPIVEISPKTVKLTLTGYGQADKKQMQKMIQLLLKLDELPKQDDAADALAIALCAVRF